MFDVGFWEIALIGVLALIILGPERLPGAARTAGAWVGKARRMMRDIKEDVKKELDQAELEQLKAVRDDIQQAGEGLKSQIDSGEKSLREEGSSMDAAIAKALDKSAQDIAQEKPSEPAPAQSEANDSEQPEKPASTPKTETPE